MKRKTFLLAVVAAIAALFVAACGSDPTAAPPTAVPQKAQATNAPAASQPTIAPASTTAPGQPTQTPQPTSTTAPAKKPAPKVPPTATPTAVPVVVGDMKIDFLTAWSEVVDAISDGYFPLRDAIESLSGGAMKVNTIGPDAVHTFEQLAPVRDGVFDMLFTHGSYHADFTTMASAFDLAAATPVVWEECGVSDLLKQVYQDNVGVRFLGFLPTDLGYRFMTKELQPIPDLTGLKLRGSAAFEPLYSALGGITVNLPITEVYTALQKDIIDGLAMGAPEAIAYKFKFYEVASYLYGPSFSASGITLLGNNDWWHSMSDAQQDIINRSIAHAQTEYRNNSKAKVGEYLDLLEGEGVHLVELSSDENAILQDTYFNSTMDKYITNGDPVYGRRMADITNCAKAKEGWPN
jgi:TRAP-type C4-dicarboxylate transport system substrate-binding protein